MHVFPLAMLRASAEPQRTPAGPGTDCGHCTLRIAGVACTEVVRRGVKKRHALYHQGDAYGAVYAVCSGTLKSAVATAEGAERVIGFPIPGELLGLDGSANGTYPTTMTALEDTAVCSMAPAGVTAMFAVSAMGREMLRIPCDAAQPHGELRIRLCAENVAGRYG